MVIVHSYVSLPEGRLTKFGLVFGLSCIGETQEICGLKPCETHVFAGDLSGDFNTSPFWRSHNLGFEYIFAQHILKDGKSRFYYHLVI